MATELLLGHDAPPFVLPESNEFVAPHAAAAEDASGRSGGAAGCSCADRMLGCGVLSVGVRPRIRRDLAVPAVYDGRLYASQSVDRPRPVHEAAFRAHSQ